MEDPPPGDAHSQETTDQQSSKNDEESISQSLIPDSDKSASKKRPLSTPTLSSKPAVKLAKTSPRSTRSSLNPDFVAKQRKFLNRVHDQIRRDTSDSENSQSSHTPLSTKLLKDSKSKSIERKGGLSNELKRKSDRDSIAKSNTILQDEDGGSPKKRRTKEPTKVVGGVDSYCWRCHRDGTVVPCEICPRVYHLKCVQMDTAPTKGWMCPECSTVMQAENTDTRSRAMRMLTLDQLCNLLRFALNRMKNYEGAEDFKKAVDVGEFPNYREYIVRPMDLALLERNIKGRHYGSTEGFLADAKWMLHDSVIFNSVQSKFTNSARALLKICRQEMQEIENCPDCYQNAHTRSSDSWFVEACRRPHVLLWAKLKGYPFWPAKAMASNSDNQIDVRFFGAHDRAWVPVSSCFLFSKMSPVPTTNKNKRSLEECLLEVECHIKKLKDKFGQFEYPPYKTPYDPNNEDAQLAMFLPKYEAKLPSTRTRISLHHDGARRVLSQSKSSPAAEEKRQAAKQPNSSPVTPQSNGKADGKSDEPTKSASPAVTKKSYKTPLTAAAKKCFANEDQDIVKHNSTTPPNNKISGKPLSSSCDTSPQLQKEKTCAKCTQTSGPWHISQSGIVYCEACFVFQNTHSPVKDDSIKKDDRVNTSSASAQDTVTSSIKIPTDTEECPKADSENINTADVAAQEPSAATDKSSECHEREEDVDVDVSLSTEAEARTSASPPTFIISKSNQKEMTGGLKKPTIVDRLKEKLFIVEEVLKSNISTEEEPETVKSSAETESFPPEKETNVQSRATTPQLQVMLHDLKNDKELMDKIKESESSKIINNSVPEETEVEFLTDSASEPETELIHNSEVENYVDEISSTKMKQNNINKVVKTIHERKSSVDEKREQTNEYPKTNGSTSLILDESNGEVPILIIDDGDEFNFDSAKKSTLKVDKSRRKGIPAKVYSRSSSSTDTSDTTAIEEQPSNSIGTKEVLDEISGQFRRHSSESNKTITVVTEDDDLPKKDNKDVRTVKISKSLSLSVVNNCKQNLETDSAVENDEEVMIDSVLKKVNARPTARKTLPNPPPLLQEKGVQIPHGKSVELQSLSSMVDQVVTPPPLLNVHRPAATRVIAPKPQKPPLPTTPTPTPSPSTPLAKNLGPANTQLDEIVNKVAGQLRSLVEEMLGSMSETGVPEAMVKTMQLEMERVQFRHRQEIAELKHNADRVILENKATLEADKQLAMLDAKHKYDLEKEQAIQETKRKQWCAFCQKEAQLYCCWNTAYCSYNCQQSHWVPHMGSCLNKQQGSNSVDASPRTTLPRESSYIPTGQPYDCCEWPFLPTEIMQKEPARRRCGDCPGCNAEPCGECYGCTNRKSHAVCKNRKCSFILTKNPERMKQRPMPPPPNPPPPYRLPFGTPTFPQHTNGMTQHLPMYSVPPYCNGNPL